jgi:hypothetical protein
MHDSHAFLMAIVSFQFSRPGLNYLKVTVFFPNPYVLYVYKFLWSDLSCAQVGLVYILNWCLCPLNVLQNYASKSEVLLSFNLSFQLKNGF